MALGMTYGGSGEGGFSDYISYNAKSGRLYRVDRVQDAGGKWDKEETEITDTFKAVADIGNIEVGKIAFGDQGPVYGLARIGQPPVVCDHPKAKAGFRLKTKLAPGCAGDANPLRDLSSSAGCVIEAIDTLHTEALAASEFKAGKLPVIAMDGVPRKIKGAHGDNYGPSFKIVSWVKRPDDMPEEEGSGSAPVEQKAALKQESKSVAPPAPIEDEDEFG